MGAKQVIETAIGKAGEWVAAVVDALTLPAASPVLVPVPVREPASGGRGRHRR